MVKILEHCCFRKHLNEWLVENERRQEAYARMVAADSGRVGAMPEDAWTLVNYGDHLFTELADWCLSWCYKSGTGATVTIAVPRLTPDTLDFFSRSTRIERLNLITATPVNVRKYSFSFKVVAVTAPDIHMQIVTLSGASRQFVINGNLLQSVCPGKYITTLGITARAYEAVQPLLNSWIRLYSKKGL